VVDSPAERRPITIGQFLPTLGELILLFLLCSATLPDEVPADGLSLRTFYHEQGSYIWTLYASALAWAFATGQIERAAAGKWSLAELFDNSADLIILGIMVSLIFVRRRWWHALAMVALASGPIGWLSRSLG
jgi:hypothetical protein